MSIQQTIEKDLHQAIINKDIVKKDLLRVVLAEMLRNTKVATDEVAIRVLKKQIESAKLCGTLNEVPILETYLPEEISDDIIRETLIDLLKVLGKTPSTIVMGDFMKSCKEVFGSKFDGKRITKILKEI
jgi:uncharacterized protein YqeY